MSNKVEEVLVPASEGRGIYVKKGQLVDIVDVEGHQVGDIIAWFRNDPAEYMSPTHTVSCNASVGLKTGSKVFSNHRNPVFTIVRDDVEKHDIVVPCFAMTSKSTTSWCRAATTSGTSMTTASRITGTASATWSRHAIYSGRNTTCRARPPGTYSCTTAYSRMVRS